MRWRRRQWRREIINRIESNHKLNYRPLSLSLSLSLQGNRQRRMFFSCYCTLYKLLITTTVNLCAFLLYSYYILFYFRLFVLNLKWAKKKLETWNHRRRLLGSITITNIVRVTFSFFILSSSKPLNYYTVDFF